MKYLCLIIMLVFIPIVVADEGCSLSNLADCIPHKIYEFVVELINEPIVPLVEINQTLLSSKVDTSLFLSLWKIMVYTISLFYGILMLYSGFNFMISGHDITKREKAKVWLKNILIMIALVQSSYFIYSIVLSLNTYLTQGIIGLINPDFFLLTIDNINNIGLEFCFTLFYLVSLLTTALFLAIRYVIVSVGVAVIPIGIFLYFIPSLNNYGSLILNFLGTSIFITFLDVIIFLVCSKVLIIPIFQNFKILLMITAFNSVLVSNIYMMFFAAIKSAFKTTEKGVSITTRIVKLAKYFL